MRITTLIENTAPEGLIAEWGLSLYIECGGKRVLLDAGTTSAFADNAKKLGVDLSKVDFAVLSHAHYDHSGGLDAFCDLNSDAPIYIRSSVRENCYSQAEDMRKYIGVQRGLLKKRADRFVRVDGDHVVSPGIVLVPHKQADMRDRGRRAKMCVRKWWFYRPDDFSHEHSLVFDLPSGLVIFNSCSHGGVDAILDEVARTFPGKPIRAMIGGFHLFRMTDRQVHGLAQRLKKAGAPHLYTGHCTGERAVEILSETMPGRVHKLETGLVFELNELARFEPIHARKLIDKHG